jgi:N utilization substance protein B
MGARAAAREAAVQMLFAADVAQHEADTIIGDFWREFPANAEDRAYADMALRGVLAEKATIDAQVAAASPNWRLERMSRIARNILRLGTWELLQRTDIPRAVIIDESVELAKRFGDKDSAAFVNGLLDRIANECGRVDTDRPPPSNKASADPDSGAPDKG